MLAKKLRIKRMQLNFECDFRTVPNLYQVYSTNFALRVVELGALESTLRCGEQFGFFSFDDRATVENALLW